MTEKGAIIEARDALRVILTKCSIVCPNGQGSKPIDDGFKALKHLDDEVINAVPSDKDGDYLVQFGKILNEGLKDD